MSTFAEFTHRKVTIGETQIHYREAGSGEAVVLLHGWPQHSLQWHAVAPRLAETYRVIVPDLPGCGGSSIPPSARYDKKSVANTVMGLLDHLQIPTARMAGYDHGAGVAYNCARHHPGRITQLALLEYVLPGLGYEKAMQPAPEWHTGSNWQLALFTVPDVAEFAFRGRERELLTWFLWHGSCNPAPISQEHLAEYVDHMSRPGALRAGIGYYAAVWTDLDDNTESLKTRLTMPVLGIGGSHNAGPFVGGSLEAAAEDVRGAVIANAGHWLTDENPEDVTRELSTFFGHA